MAQRQRKGQVASWRTGCTGLLPAPALEKKGGGKNSPLLLPLCIPLNSKSILYYQILILVSRHPVLGPQYPQCDWRLSVSTLPQTLQILVAFRNKIALVFKFNIIHSCSGKLGIL